MLNTKTQYWTYEKYSFSCRRKKSFSVSVTKIQYLPYEKYTFSWRIKKNNSSVSVVKI